MSAWCAAGAWSTQNAAESADFRGPLDIAVAATVLLDAQDTVIGWSPGAENLLGYPPAEVVGRPVGAFLSGGPMPVAGSGHGLPLSGSDVRLARHRDGRSLSVATAVCELSEAGRVARVLVAAELEGLRQWESRLAMLQGLATQSPLGLAIYDTDLRLTWDNSASGHEIGRPFAQYRGMRADELYPGGKVITEGYPESLDAVMRNVLETGEPVLDLHFLAQMPSDPGADHVWSCSYYRLQDAEGHVLGVCEDAFDITDRYVAQKRLALLVDAGRMIGTSLDVTATAREIADVVVPDFASSVAVDVVQAVLEGEEPRAAAGAGAALVRVVGPADGEVTTGREVTAGGEFTAGGEGPPRLVHHPPGSPQRRSLASGGLVVDDNVLVVPLRTGAVQLGLVTYTRDLRPSFFDNGEVALADELTTRAAVCIDNARRYTRERAAALTLQRQLLPQHLPRRSAVEVAHRYLPADGVTGVGGDWFDVIPLSGARVGLVVGDVVGHGLAAAATMGRLRTTVEALAKLDMPPDELLTQLDDLVGRPAETEGQQDFPSADADAPGVPHPDVTTGASCLYAVYDPVTRRCTMARAGHLPPLVVTPDGTPSFPDLPAGPPLGLGGLPFESLEVELPAGTLLALFTDGLVESRDHDIDQGLDILKRVLSHPERPLEELCERAVAELLPGGTTADDTALLLIRTRELDADHVAAWELPAETVAVGHARELATEQLGEWGLDELGFSTELVVSELVTNAVRYAEGPLQLRLIRDRTLLCEVADTGHTSPHLRHSTAEDEGGRGLFIVSQLVQRWGTRYSHTGKTIWTEQAFPTNGDGERPLG
ncbi:SpoIIE family protein phosphatase [Streptomyces sp. NPDC096176]|uniref:SpoIIE family protein phosphatase n=1 Tax=Streptomyces sp. NPDC096176 TaxID=3366079 RepID=UPI0038111776